MRLRDLSGQFLRILDATTWEYVTALKDAHGVRFLCPKCFEKNGGAIGTHAILCWFVGVDQNIDPKPGRWTPSGTSLDDLTFIPGPGGTPSVKLTSPDGCQWHGLVKNGEVTLTA